MTVRLHWFLPTGGDGRTLVDRHAYGPGRAGTALVGSHAEVADLIEEYEKAEGELRSAPAMWASVPFLAGSGR
jgi:alkanesulfonate monooxygenase